MKKVNKSKILKSLMILGSVGSLASIISTVALSPFQQTPESKISNTAQEVTFETIKENIEDEYQTVLKMIVNNKLSPEQEKVIKTVMHQTSKKLINENLDLSQVLQIIEDKGVKVDKNNIQENLENAKKIISNNSLKSRKKRSYPEFIDFKMRDRFGNLISGDGSYSIKENAKHLHNKLKKQINELRESTNKLQTIYTGLITAAIILINPLIITIGVVLYTIITETNKNSDNILNRIQEHLFDVANFELEIVINTFGYLDAIADQLVQDASSAIGIFTNIMTKPANKISEEYLKIAGYALTVKMLLSLLEDIKKVIKSNRNHLYNEFFL
ncbi:hypothetical protein CJJ23_00685 [Mycoplasmopsis agassizii]|uniref:Uncharacterized protein n=1 Tax=Mycoplasmopsis agassizii TaxID=33922 RepID=A0A269TJL6_9BACT|nr:hypothetical protein [Mycoplasmopsis agassizii]PAK21644.1 hypothetical protein CJJ23_00685 [Mycoplasmopsis agassizii]